MIICKEINDYIEYANQHSKWINNDRKLLIKNIVKPLLKRKDVLFDEDTYRKCLAFCEKNYYPLFPFQKFIYAFVFMYNDDRPIFPKIFMMMGRGNGKDGLMVPLANFLQTPLYGVKNYHIELVANSEQQIKDTFAVAYDEMSLPKWRGKFKVTKEEIKNISTGSVLRYNTSNSSTKDGKRPGCIFFNELHAYVNYDTINVFESAMGKVKHPREIIITTQGYVREGPLDELLDQCTAILESGENPTGIFPFICRLDDEKEIDNEESWHKANPSMEYMPILAQQIKADYVDMKMLPSKRAEFVTKRMNLPDRNEEETVTSWNNILRCCYDDIKLKTLRQTNEQKGKNAIIGIDYADVRDFASAGILTKDGDEYVFRQHTWICSESPFLSKIKFPLSKAGMEEFKDFEIVYAPTIPIDDMIRWVRDRMSEYNVVKIAMDTYRYEYFKQMFIQEGISIESRQDPDGLVRLIRRLGSAMGIIAPAIEAEFAQGNINFGQSAIMRWYTNNTCVLTDKYGNKAYGKIEPKLRKNDGFMAFLVAFFCRDLLDEAVIYI